MMRQISGLLLLASSLCLIPAVAAPEAPPASQPAPTTEAKIYPRWLAIGDSITAHGPKAELQWDGPTRGMAASTLETDYIHQLQGLLQTRDKRNGTDIKILGRFARLSAGTIEQMNSALGEIKSFNADLVTVQLGENDRFREIGRDEFEHRYRTLIDGLLSMPKRPQIVCTGVWTPDVALDPTNSNRYKEGSEAQQKDVIIESICLEKGLLFVPVASFASKAENHGFGAVPGVQWHPNDKGMKAYADAIFAAL